MKMICLACMGGASKYMPSGVYVRVKPISDETRRKLGVWKEGRVSGMKGKNHTEEVKKRIKENSPHYWAGKTFSEQHKESLSRAKGGHNTLYGSLFYESVHRWVVRELGKPKVCDDCHTSEAKIYDWANLSQLYKKDLSDWRRLCRKCHVNYDHKFKKGLL